MRTFLMTTAAALLGAVVASPGMATAPNDSVSLLGVTIGEPLQMRSCAVERRTNPATLCWTVSRLKEVPAGMTAYQIYPASKPSFLQSDHIFVYTMDGKVEDISILTDGSKSQEAVLRQLTEKFGNPGAIEQTTLQNSYGAQFPSIIADWNVGDVKIKFNGIIGDMNTGNVDAISAKGMEARIKSFTARRAAEPHL